MSYVAPRPYENLVDLRDRAREEVGKVVVGQGHAVDLLLVAALAQGHVLIEGPPGSAKTLLGRAMAHVLGAKFKRIQFTPDTTPDKITGSNTTKMGEQVFMPGVVFTNVLLADEINRTPPRTQAALLEAMQERTVTVEGKTHQLPGPVPRHRDPEPVRARGHLPAARVAARPLPVQDHPRLRGRGERDRHAPAPAHRRHAGHARRDPLSARRRRPRPGAARPRRNRGAGARSHSTSSRSCATRDRTRASSSARAPARRSTCSAPRRRRRASTAATPSRSRTCARSRRTSSATASSAAGARRRKTPSGPRSTPETLGTGALATPPRPRSLL